jgi:hypothetical protein
MTKIQFTLAVIGIVLFTTFMVEAFGMMPRYVREPATIVNVND